MLNFVAPSFPNANLQSGGSVGHSLYAGKMPPAGFRPDLGNPPPWMQGTGGSWVPSMVLEK